MAGGLFAAERQYFFEIGSYDSGMDIWGIILTKSDVI